MIRFIRLGRENKQSLVLIQVKNVIEVAPKSDDENTVWVKYWAPLDNGSGMNVRTMLVKGSFETIEELIQRHEQGQMLC